MELSPELMQLLMASGQRGAEEQGLDRQQQMVDRMRMGGSGGNGIQAGRMFVGKQPLNGLADIMSGAMAQHMQPGLDARRGAIAQQRDNGRMQYVQQMIQALRNGGVGMPSASPGALSTTQPFNPQAGP